MEFLHFLNLQYWYCTVYTLLGGECTAFDELRAQREAERAAEGGGGSATEILSQYFDAISNALSQVFGPVWDIFATVVSWLWGVFSTASYAFSNFLFLAILVALFGLIFIRLRELNTYGTLPPKDEIDNPRALRWKELLEEALSTDPKRWRYAILEADKMLGELLETLGYTGATTADRLRAVPEDAFVTVPNAWEAHRVRNFVSAGSSDFILTGREAFRVMKLYEQVFEEHRFI